MKLISAVLETREQEAHRHDWWRTKAAHGPENSPVGGMYIDK
jgi:hypothetical protein